MDDGLKQRLVGAIVIVAAAIIFLPMIFNDAETRPEDILVEIPPRPEAPEPKLVKPKRPVSDRPSPEIPAAADDQNDNSNESQKEAVKASEGHLPSGWVLQMASFKDRGNADKLRDKLRKAGYSSYVTYRADKKDNLARVFVGPELDRTTLEKLKSKLKKEFKLDGFVVRYLPE